MRKILLTAAALFLITLTSANGQVTSIKYLLEYNCETNFYDVNLKVLEGSASSIVHRAQFNSQISIVIPTGSPIEIAEKFFPLENHQSYSGTTPMNWKLSSPVLSPEGYEAFDFYSIIPTLTPASFYNDLTVGDEVTIFSISLGEDSEYDSTVRFFDNETDPFVSNFEGSDLRNGFTIGSSQNIYDGNIHRACNTSVQHSSDIEIKIYPNPASDSIHIDLLSDSKVVNLIDRNGKSVLVKKNLKKGLVTLDISHLAKGLYVIQIEGERMSFSRLISVL